MKRHPRDIEAIQPAESSRPSTPSAVEHRRDSRTLQPDAGGGASAQATTPTAPADDEAARALVGTPQPVVWKGDRTTFSATAVQRLAGIEGDEWNWPGCAIPWGVGAPAPVGMPGAPFTVLLPPGSVAPGEAALEQPAPPPRQRPASPPIRELPSALAARWETSLWSHTQ